MFTATALIQKQVSGARRGKPSPIAARAPWFWALLLITACLFIYGCTDYDAATVYTASTPNSGREQLSAIYDQIIFKYYREPAPKEILTHALEGLAKPQGMPPVGTEWTGDKLSLVMGRKRIILGPVNNLAAEYDSLLAAYDFALANSPGIDPRSIWLSMAKSMAALDPHSSYLTASEYKQLKEDAAGRFSGVGIEITIRDKKLIIVSPIEGTPGHAAGLLANDHIWAVDGAQTKGLSLMDIVKLIRGPEGTLVTLEVVRKGRQGRLIFKIRRSIIPLKSITHKMLRNGIEYIRISTFQENSAGKLLEVLEDIQSRGGAAKGLVLDLRNNPGGLLDECAMIADSFLSDNKKIVSIQGRDKSQVLEMSASQNQLLPNLPMVVLLNNGSASASEIVSGALQDNKRALLVGTQSFGKGSVQSILPLAEGALRLTTSQYMTPDNKFIQAIGIKPDVYMPFRTEDGDINTEPVTRERDLENSLSAASDYQKISLDGTPWLKNLSLEIDDNQLEFAIQVLEKYSATLGPWVDHGHYLATARSLINANNHSSMFPVHWGPPQMAPVAAQRMRGPHGAYVPLAAGLLPQRPISPLEFSGLSPAGRSARLN